MRMYKYHFYKRSDIKKNGEFKKKARTLFSTGWMLSKPKNRMIKYLRSILETNKHLSCQVESARWTGETLDPNSL